MSRVVSLGTVCGSRMHRGGRASAGTGLAVATKEIRKHLRESRTRALSTSGLWKCEDEMKEHRVNSAETFWVRGVSFLDTEKSYETSAVNNSRQPPRLTYA